MVDPGAVDGRTVLRRLVGLDDGRGAGVGPILVIGGTEGTGGTVSISIMSGIERVVAFIGMKAMVGETEGVSPCCCIVSASTATGCRCIPWNHELVLIFLVLGILAPGPELDGRWGRGATTVMLKEDALSAFCSSDDIELDFHVLMYQKRA